MNSIRLHLSKLSHTSYITLYNVLRIAKFLPNCTFTSNVDIITSMPTELLHRPKTDHNFGTSNYIIKCTKNADSKTSISSMSDEDIDNLLLQMMSRNKDKRVEEIVEEHHDNRKFINEATIKKLFRHYSLNGKPEMVSVLQKYCAKVDPNLYKRNVEFLHYLAKAQCMKGNSEKGLSILQLCYQKYDKRRNLYRMLFRELIQDSVLNRSEASLVTFKKYTLEFSKLWDENYPLLCLWYICWSSTWFSDQMLSNELLESSEALLDIIRDKATTFSITVLREYYNEDAVMRLLQILLKYDMITEYAKVLQILFNYKLKNKDIRGCTEIIRNCQVLGITLPSDQQGRYIKMLIEGKKPEDKQSTAKLPFKDFKMKF